MSTHLLSTEQINTASLGLDRLSLEQAAALMNQEDGLVAARVAAALPEITAAVRLITAAMAQGGRLIYVGAGNSGRLGYLDAFECQPTFSMPAGRVLGLIAGGFDGEVEAAEDHADKGQADLESHQLQALDVVVGVSASGRTPYVLGALRYARQQGCPTISVACNVGSELAAISQVAIEVDSGPEVLAGSTRLKAGTAQKMVCNMLSTLTMVSLGKTYGNLMVDVQVRNQKLLRRAQSIVMQATEVSAEEAAQVLQEAGLRPRIAILMLKSGLGLAQAEALSAAHGGSIHRALAAVGVAGAALSPHP